MAKETGRLRRLIGRIGRMLGVLTSRGRLRRTGRHAHPATHSPFYHVLEIMEAIPRIWRKRAIGQRSRGA